MQNRYMDEEEKEAQEKKALLEYIQMQNETLKRIFKNTIDKKEEDK